MTDRELMQQALYALDAYRPVIVKRKGLTYSLGDKAIAALRERLAQPERVQLTVKDFVTTVGGIENAVGTPTYWAEWPNKKHEPTIDLDKYAGTYGGYIKEQK